MKFLCMIYFDERKAAELPEAELRGIVDECMTYSEQLRSSGNYNAARVKNWPSPMDPSLKRGSSWVAST